MSIVYGIKGNDTLYAKIVDDDYQLLDNETFNQPEDGICKPFLFDSVQKTIIGISQEDFEKKHSSKDKTSEELISDLTKQLAVAQINQAKTNTRLLQQNAELIKQVAYLQLKKETTHG